MFRLSIISINRFAFRCIQYQSVVEVQKWLGIAITRTGQYMSILKLKCDCYILQSWFQPSVVFEKCLALVYAGHMLISKMTHDCFNNCLHIPEIHIQHILLGFTKAHRPL